MKSLSQSEYGELRSLYSQVYASREVEITEELIDEIFDELLDELVEEGYEQEEAIEILDEAIDDYLAEGYYDSAVSGSKKNAAALDRAARQKRRAGQARYYKRKAGEALSGAKKAVKGAVDTAKKKAAGAATAAVVAGSLAKKTAQDAPSKARAAASDAKKKAKSGIKGFIKRQAEKVVSRMSEEAVGEGIDFKGAAREQARRDAIQAEKDKKSPSSKHRRLAMGKFRPGASAAERAEGGRDAMREKGTSPTKNGKKMFEELQATGLFTDKEIQALMDAE